MLISKLKPNDSLGMVLFNNRARVLFESTAKKNIGADIFEKLDNFQAGGGTTIIHGFT